MHDAASRDPEVSLSGRILIIDDEDRILQFVARGLRSEGYVVDVCADPDAGLNAALVGGYDLVILDLLMPALPGITILDRLIQRRPQQVVIVLSCLTDSRTKVQCFQLGADDYVAKPFSFHELLERVKVRIRSPRTSAGPLEIGSLQVDLVRRQVQVGTKPVALTEREFLLLWELIQHPGSTVSKEHLLAAVWGYKFDPGSNVIDVYVARLRQKIGFNSLPLAASKSHVEPLLTIDQTLHWADPLNAGNSFRPYAGPVPGVVHLHGAEVLSAFNGVPEAWFTPDGIHGRGYNTFQSTASNAAVYHYPNTQPATTLWFHDHTLGITRINVFSGLAAFYFVRDQFDTGQPDNPMGLPAGSFEIELMIQDRFFDTNGQLRFPDGSNTSADLNGPPTNPPAHPFWIPEFFGDAMCVNGNTWPVLNVEPRRYRLRFVDACNARFLRMNLTDAANASSTTPPSAIPFWQIGTDGGFLDVPVKLNDPANPNALKLFLGPSERADVIIDFAGFQGRSLILTNDGIFPFPSGGPPNPNLDGQILEINVSLPLSSTDNTYNPATGAPLRGGANQEPVIVRLANPTNGTFAPGVQFDKKQQLVIFEQDTFANVTNPNCNGSLEDLLNNTRWKGVRDGTSTPLPGSVQDQQGQGLWQTELPKVGATELWELLDTTPDSHPIHIHLIQFQVLNRQSADVTNFMSAWARQFPGGTFAGQNPDGTLGEVTYAPGTIIPGYGPPNDYNTPNKDGAVGGNPAFNKFLNGPVVPPDPNEAGWKDTFKILPGMVNRVLVRWAPTETAIADVQPGVNKFQFDPTVGPSYVWHCHILDHEDVEMMRPYIPVK